MASPSPEQPQSADERLDLRPAFLFIVFGVGALGSLIANALWWVTMR
jgi:hypothetical protein